VTLPSVPEPPRTVDAWLRVEPDGSVTVFTGKVEVGQNIRTALAQVVAEELRLPVERVELVMADTDRVPYDQGTFGSQSTPRMAPQLRRAAATAREALLSLAAERWEANRVDLQVRDGAVVHPETGQALGFAELVVGRRLNAPIPEDPPVTPPDAWRIAGTSVPKAEARRLVTGQHRYAADVALPGMLHGKVLRPAGFGAKLRTLDTAVAERLPDVVVVRDGDFVGVAAPDPSAAAWALATIRAGWELPAQPSSRELWEYLRRHPADPSEPLRPGREPFESGSVDEGLALADQTVSQTYTAAYIAHAPLEPRAAVAHWEGDRLTVWTGTQRPFGVRQQLVELFGLPEEAVRVVVPDTGSGYGGKHQGDAALEAARLARAAGRPVKVVWTREEEMTWAYLRPAGLMELRAGVRADGTLVAWEHHTYNAGPSAIRTPYTVPHQRAVFHPTLSPLRQGAYRALATTANVFARESLMDELAHLVGQDPLAFRLRNLADERLRAVLEAAAERFGWGDLQPSPGRGRGLACGVEKGGYVATCAEVVAEPSPSGGISALRVVRVVEAFECGAVINPEHLRSTIEGAIVQGLGGALFEAIEFADGRVLNPRFSQYRVPRFDDVPAIETVLLDRRDLPSAGGGETPIVGVAPAVANALYHATGLRRRGMPLLGASTARS
jgi:isoquinoline 1-oxidoreductase